ncbi:hypothetical protein LEMLEM_LOCUS9176 [Lemmus lemmus]
MEGSSKVIYVCVILRKSGHDQGHMCVCVTLRKSGHDQSHMCV